MSTVVLVTAAPRDASTASPTTIRLAGGGNVNGYHYGGNHFRAGIATLPRFRAEIGFDDNGWTGGVVPITGQLVWAPYGKTPLAELAEYYWPGAAITIETGSEATGSFTTLLTGKVADAAVQDHRLVITVADFSKDLDKPLVTARFAGTGGAEGGTEAAERLKRRTWGRAFNIEGRVLDKANNIYEFGDPSFPWQSFETLRDKGREADPAPDVVTWQGSVAATLTALIASTPATGSGVVAPSIACCKWWTQPAGPLTADVKGEIGAGYVETAASIAEAILDAVSGPSITNVATADGWRAGVCGIHVDERETTAQALDRLLLGTSLLWILNPTGTVTLREFAFSSPAASLASDSVQRLRTLPPVKTRRLGYQRSYRTHSDGEIATSLLQTNPDAASQVNGPAAVTIEADYTGTVVAGQLPLNTMFKLMGNDGSDLTESAAWSRTVVSGSYTGTIGAANGILNTTTLGSLESLVRVSAVIADTEKSLEVKFRRNDALPPTGGEGGSSSGGTIATKSSFNFVTGTSMATIHSGTMAPTVGSAGKVKLTATLTVSGDEATPDGVYEARVIFQRDIVGTWTDIGSETASDPDLWIDIVTLQDGDHYFTAVNGQIAFNTTVTGLTPATNPEFRMRGRVTTTGKTIYFSGNLVADGTVP